MSTNSILSKIRQEIERRKELLTPHKGQGVILCREIIKQFDSLLSFIDTISQPIMKDDIIDEIRAEIERRFLEYNHDSNHHIQAAECASILDFLDTLEEEPNKDLEEEINRYLEPIHAADIQFEPFTQMTKCARHFAKWGADHLRDSTKMVDNDLEKELESFMKENIPYGQGGYGDMMRIARHFAEWGAEHLKK